MDYFLGQLLLVGFPFAPKGWALCNGQLLPVNQNQGLFSLIGANFGGNGSSTFALPDLRGRVAAGPASGVNTGLLGGSESVTLLVAQNPVHSHSLTVSTTTPPTLHTPVGSTVGPEVGIEVFSLSSTLSMDQGSISATGGQSHENRSPYLTLNWIIALQGIFPSRN